MRKRGKRERPAPRSDATRPVPHEPTACWLCGRPLGHRVEWHHPWPKSRGGREVAPVHPICHRAIHASFSNVELARLSAEGARLGARPEMQKFLAWIADKPPDFHAPTRARR